MSSLAVAVTVLPIPGGLCAYASWGPGGFYVYLGVTAKPGGAAAPGLMIVRPNRTPHYRPIRATSGSLARRAAIWSAAASRRNARNCKRSAIRPRVS